MGTPTRPPGLPAAAYWSPSDNEWIDGPRDTEGRFQGLVKYWRPDGTLCCACEHDGGQPHGASTRYHESGERSQSCTFERGKLHGTRTWYATDQPTSEKMHENQMSTTVRRAEIDYDHDRIVAMRYFDAAGIEVARNGDQLRPRPPGVDPAASYAKGNWVLGTWDGEGRRDGTLRYWNQDGVLGEETEYKADRAEGRHRSYDEAGPREECIFAAHHRQGAARLYWPGGGVAREAGFHAGAYEGALRDFDRGGKIVREARFSGGARVEPPYTRVRPEAARVSTPARWQSRKPSAGRLDLSGCGLEVLPDEVRAMTSLTVLELDHNRLRTLPAWLAELTYLETMTLQSNRLMPPRPGRLVLGHLASTKERPLAERKLLFCLFLGDLAQAREHGGVADLTRALCEADRAVRLNAQLALSQARPAPLSPGATYFFAGVPRTSRAGGLRERGLTAATSIERADVVVAGERPPRVMIDAAIARGAAVVVEADVEEPVEPRALSELLVAARLGGGAMASAAFRRKASTAALAFCAAYPVPLDDWYEKRMAPRLRTLRRSGLFDVEPVLAATLRHNGAGVSLALAEGGDRARAALRAAVKDGALALTLKSLTALPPEIGELAEINKLDVSHNQLIELPDEIGDLWSLRSLHLSYNQLQRLPRTLERLVQVHSVRLDAARAVESFEPLFRMPRVTSLSLGSGHFEQVPPGISALTGLEEVWLNHNGLKDLPRELAQLSSLTFLHLSGNPLGDVPAFVFEMTQLKTLWLEACQLTRLSPAIGQLQNLEELCVWYNKLTELPRELLELPKLKEVRISSNKFDFAEKKRELQQALPRCVIY